MAGSDKVLVYFYRDKRGLEEMTKDDLDKVLADNFKLKASTKALKRDDKVLEIVPSDLYTSEQLTDLKGKVNSTQSIASVTLPSRSWLSNKNNGKYEELIIVSAK